MQRGRSIAPPSSRTARRSSSSSHSTVKRFSTKKPRVFLLHRTISGFLDVPGFSRSITCHEETFREAVSDFLWRQTIYRPFRYRSPERRPSGRSCTAVVPAGAWIGRRKTGRPSRCPPSKDPSFRSGPRKEFQRVWKNSRLEKIWSPSKG